MEDFSPTLTARDVIEAFDCSPNEATLFLKAYGVKIGGRYGISQSKFRFLQLNGTAMEFFARKVHHNGRPPKVRKG